MQRQFNGISFRERGAGSELDNHMHEAGFNVSVGVQERTGFVYGGSQWNAGTWMDKVGESRLAGNFGVPATPRYILCLMFMGAGTCPGGKKFTTDLFCF